MAKVVGKKLGRPHLMKDPAVKGKLTGTALHVPTIDVSAVNPLSKSRNRLPGGDLRGDETLLRDRKGVLD